MEGKENARNRANTKQAVFGQRPAFGEIGNKCISRPLSSQISLKPVEKPKSNLLKPLEKPKANLSKPLEKSNSLKVKKVESTEPKPDDNCKDDPQMVPEYVTDIVKNLLFNEIECAIKEDFLADHLIKPNMRSKLIDWLVTICGTFKVGDETFYITVDLIDRYLQAGNIVKEKLQLLGATAFYLACKYEEIYVPYIEDIRYICNDIYKAREILELERSILEKLEFRLSKPTKIFFLKRYSNVAKLSAKEYHLSKYILELVTLEYHLAHVRPSLLAAGVCCLSMGIARDEIDLQALWTTSMIQCSSYEYHDFRPVLRPLAHLIQKIELCKFQASRQKFASPKFCKISTSSILMAPIVKKLIVGKKVTSSL
ncbi:unnamed protein product [Phyllotreta striolata]|uniref:Uncharacterized protein n=1 Tax=Phyllotreta striolata TaxID=444603 RepID=A0A9N9TXK7_PHYSR|nr:unnamed protein product [Phyllotreta striolata]